MAEKKPRRKKSLNVELENKALEPQVEKQAEPKVPNLDPKAKYEFIANGKFPTLPKGTKWNITGETAMIFIARGYGELKK